MSVFAAEGLQCVQCISARELENRLLDGLSSSVVFWICSDLGFATPFVPACQDLPVFVWQNFGEDVQSSGGLQEMIGTGRIVDMVVCGHHPCTYIETILSAEGEFATFNAQSRELKNLIANRFGSRRDQEVYKTAAEQLVLLRMGELLRLTCAEDTLCKQRVRLRGWFWSDLTSQLTAFDPQIDAFRLADGE